MQVNSTGNTGNAIPAVKPPAADAKQDAKLRSACVEFESVFLNMLLTQMRQTIPKGGLLPQSNEQDIMQSMLDSEMAKNMSAAGGIGLSDMLYRQLTLPTAKPETAAKPETTAKPDTAAKGPTSV